MTHRLDSNYIAARNDLINVIPELKGKIEAGTITHSDILKIARSVILAEMDGSILISRNDPSKIHDRKVEVSNKEIELIRKICSKQIDILSEPSEKKDKDLQDSRVNIVRKRDKQKEDKSVNDNPPSLKRSLELSDFFNKDSDMPDSIMWLNTEYLSEISSAFTDLVREKRVPGYLKNVAHLDLSNENLTCDVFSQILSGCTGLQSIKLPQYADDSFLEVIANNFPNLKSLDIQFCKKITDSGFKHFVDRMISIEILILSHCDLKDDAINYAIEKLENLKELDIDTCKSISDKALENIEKRSETLRCLNLSNTEISDKSLLLISNNTKDLQTLILQFCKKITNDGVDHIVKKLNKLQVLDLSVCLLISDKGLLNINALRESLESLKMIGCNITGSFLATIDQNFKAMKRLELLSCKHLDEKNLSNFLSHFPTLEHLNLGLNTITPDGLGRFFQGTSNLESIDLERSTKVNDASLKFIADNCPNLKKLNVHMCYVNVNGISRIAKKCPNLTELIASHCEIGTHGLKSLADNCHQLRTLDLGNSNITDTGLAYLSVGCPNLTKIVLRNCASITDSGILNLSHGIKSLQFLDITWCTNVSSNSMGYISKWSNSLETLNMGQTLVTGSAIIDLKLEFPLLHSLDLAQCHDIDDRVLQKIVQLFPSLKKLTIPQSKKITDEGVSYLTSLKQLTDLNLYACESLTNLAVEHCINMPRIRFVSFRNCSKITNVAIENLKSKNIIVDFNY